MSKTSSSTEGRRAAANSPQRQPVVFLDRDGVINQDRADFVRSVDSFRPLAGSLEAIARLGRAGYRVVVITNQSGLARGLFERDALDEIHDRLEASVRALGGRIDGIFVCPHGPDDGCDCRKPAPGLIRQAALALGVEPRGAPFVGDRASDVRAAWAAGCRAVGVGPATGFADLLPDELARVERHADLAEFVSALLGAD